MKPTLAEIHPELFHYTGIAGVEGIVKSQMLRATHAAFLNDSSEVRALQGQLPELLRPAVTEGIEELVRQVPLNAELMRDRGGKEAVVDEVVHAVTHGMFSTLLGDNDTQAFINPYIFSFCTTDIPEVSQHGLLSQWRGYGRAGGYALVFDTAGLDSLLKQEGAKWEHDLFGGDVVYSSDPQEKFFAELGSDIDTLRSSVGQWLKTAGLQLALEPTLQPLIRCACRYKHWGFHEEKEVRIITIPQSEIALRHAKKSGMAVLEKPVHHFTRNGQLVPCINLFEDITRLPDVPLPLRRIIVGPHPAQRQRQRAIESFLGEYRLDIPVTTSEIPYVENAYGN